MKRKNSPFQSKDACWIEAPRETAAESTAENISVISETGEVVAGVTEQTGEQINPLFQKRFFLEKRPEKAVLRATACGVYRAYINGICVSPGLFDPGWTDYENRIQVQEIQVAGALKEGENTIGILTAGGWALTNLLGQGARFYSDTVSVIAELEMTSGDETNFLVTDGTWEVWDSPIRFSSWYNGEVLDYARVPGLSGNAVPAGAAARVILPDGTKQTVTGGPEGKSVSYGPLGL